MVSATTTISSPKVKSAKGTFLESSYKHKHYLLLLTEYLNLISSQRYRAVSNERETHQ